MKHSRISSFKARTIHSPKYIERMRRRRQILFFLAVLCLVTVSASGILLMRASFLQIKTITVEGSTYVPQEAVAVTALSSLIGDYFGIIPHSSTVFFPKGNIEEALQNNFKHIKTFSIHRSGFSSLRLSVQERTPAAVVCAGFRDEETSNECYVSDDHGMIFAEVASSSETSSLHHYYIPTDDSTMSLGSTFIPEKKFKDLQKFLEGSLRGGLTPLGVLIAENGEYEMYVKNLDGTSEVTVYFDDRAPFDATLENLLTFWNNSKNDKKITGKNFDYINLRFGNTVYYSTQ